MKLLLAVMVLSVHCAFAQVKGESLATQVPDSEKALNRNQFHRLLMEEPRVERDGVVVGNTKYFIMIFMTAPSIDPGMIMKIPDSLNVDRMPPPPGIPGRPQRLNPDIDHMPEVPLNNPGCFPRDSTRRIRYR